MSPSSGSTLETELASEEVVPFPWLLLQLTSNKGRDKANKMVFAFSYPHTMWVKLGLGKGFLKENWDNGERKCLLSWVPAFTAFARTLA